MADPTPGTPEGEKAGNELQEKLQKSDRALAIERAARVEAEKRSGQSAAELARANDQLGQSRVAQVDSSITGLESKRDRLIKDHAQALADGEFEKASKLQFEMGECASELSNAKGVKTHLEGLKTKPAITDPNKSFDKEEFLSQRTPATAAWLRQNDRYFTDTEFQRQVTRAHNAALGEGLDADTPDYFTFIEKRVGLQAGDDNQDGGQITPRSDPVRTPGKRPQPAIAPTRSGGGSNPKLKAGDVYISPEMRAAAKICDITPEEYREDYIRRVEAGEISDHLGVFTRR